MTQPWLCGGGSCYLCVDEAAAILRLDGVYDGRAAGVQEGQEGFRVVEEVQVEEREARGALECVEQKQRLPCVDRLTGRDKGTAIVKDTVTILHNRIKYNYYSVA